MALALPLILELLNHFTITVGLARTIALQTARFRFGAQNPLCQYIKDFAAHLTERLFALEDTYFE